MDHNSQNGIRREDFIVINSDSDEDDLFNQFLVRQRDDQLSPFPDTSRFEVQVNRQDTGSDLAPILPWSPPTIIDDPKALYEQCQEKVLEVLPDVCRDHLKAIYNEESIQFEAARSAESNGQLAQAVIIKLLESDTYPKESEKRKMLKRKRTTSDEEEEEGRYRSLDRTKLTTQEILEARMLLVWEFVNVPLSFIDRQLKQSGNLFLAYEAIELAERNYDMKANRLYQRLAKSRKSNPNSTIPDPTQPNGNWTSGLKQELLAARHKREKDDAQRKEKRLREEADAALMKESTETGNIIECQCCFADTPVPKTTSCIEGHFFCLDCALSHAKARIEISRYDITCMDGSGCKAEFSRHERNRFLDEKLLGVLERLQQQADLRAADLDGLDSCPFCDFAAICPPIEVDKEFRCQMPDCEAISCRLCRAISHLPMTCEEWKKEQGISERHIVEEAMTQALIRKCPKCQVPILKDGGCNKLICSKCRCFVCDYCGKDISKEGYSHFDMGGPMDGPNAPRRKKCPSTEDTVRRNDERVKQAEKEAMEKVRAENPELSEEDLKVKFSAAVSAVAQNANPYGHGPPMMYPHHVVGRGPLARAPRAPRPPHRPRPEMPVLPRENINIGIHIGYNPPGIINPDGVIPVQPSGNDANPFGNLIPNRPHGFFDEAMLQPPPFVNGRAGREGPNVNDVNIYMGVPPPRHGRAYQPNFPVPHIPVAPMRRHALNQHPADYGQFLDAHNAPNVVPVDYTGGQQAQNQWNQALLLDPANPPNPPNTPHRHAPGGRRRNYDERWG